jgi:hypothetical protein
LTPKLSAAEFAEARKENRPRSPIPVGAPQEGTKRTKLLKRIPDNLAGGEPPAGASNITKVEAMCGYRAFGHHMWRWDQRSEFAIVNLPKDQELALHDAALVLSHIERLKFGLHDNVDISHFEDVDSAIVTHKPIGCCPLPIQSSRDEAGSDHMPADKVTVAAEPTKHAPAKTGFQLAEA